jgi:hypothetical protein
MIDGVLCNAIQASAVKHLIVKSKAVKKENVKHFYVTPEEKTLKAKFPDAFGNHGFKTHKAGKHENKREQLNHIRAVQLLMLPTTLQQDSNFKVRQSKTYLSWRTERGIKIGFMYSYHASKPLRDYSFANRSQPTPTIPWSHHN